MAIKSSGGMEMFSSGAQRDKSRGKGRPSLISPILIYRLSRHLEFGARHYGDRNWEKGMPFSRVIDSMIRHVFQYMAGMDDEDHLAAIVCNTMFLMHYEAAVAEDVVDSGVGWACRTSLDDRPLDHQRILEKFLTSLNDEARLGQQAAKAATEEEVRDGKATK